MLFRKCVILTLLVLTLTGCVGLNTTALKRTPFKDDSNTVYVENVPFVKQRFFYCGPASLESVLGYWGKDISQKKIADSIYFSKSKGTFNFEMVDFATREGFFTEDYSGSLKDLNFYLSKQIPVVILFKKGFLFSDYHYQVVVGINEKNGYLIVNDGVRKEKLIHIKRFSNGWKKAKNWMLVVVPPDKVDWLNDPSDYNRLGILCEENNNLELAKKSFLRAIVLDSKNSLLYFNLANTYLAEEDFSKAIENYRRALEYSPDFADCYNNLAYALAMDGRLLDEAKSFAKKAIELEPSREFWYMDTLGLVNLKAGKFEEAIRNFKRCIENSENSDSKDLDAVYRHLAEAYKSAGIDIKDLETKK